eukprot:6200676-Pleurochrysis_carterae.AAC.1
MHDQQVAPVAVCQHGLAQLVRVQDGAALVARYCTEELEQRQQHGATRVDASQKRQAWVISEAADLRLSEMDSACIYVCQVCGESDTFFQNALDGLAAVRARRLVQQHDLLVLLQRDRHLELAKRPFQDARRQDQHKDHRFRHAASHPILGPGLVHIVPHAHRAARLAPQHLAQPERLVARVELVVAQKAMPFARLDRQHVKRYAIFWPAREVDVRILIPAPWVFAASRRAACLNAATPASLAAHISARLAAKCTRRMFLTCSASVPETEQVRP